jgi:ribosomal protein S18 acetylase RimI-like enzyme
VARSNGPAPLTYRSASAADAEAIASLHVASWRDAYRDFVPAAFLEAQDVAARTAYWREQLATPGVAVLLAESINGLAGFCACGPARDAHGANPPAWEIYNLHVSPQARSRGIGARLFADAAERGALAGYKHLTLWVIAPNLAARRFYARHGMTPDGGEQVRPLGGGPTVSELRYRVDLPLTVERRSVRRPPAT